MVNTQLVKSVELTASQTGDDGKLTVAGVDISNIARNVRIDVGGGRVTRVDIELMAVHIVFRGQAGVSIDPRARDALGALGWVELADLQGALIALGWTPPHTDALVRTDAEVSLENSRIRREQARD
jgi:hypothetical protein